jgi:hypothetical protein
MKARNWKNAQLCSTLRWRFATVNSAADVLEVFKRHAAPCALRRLHNGFRETMIDIRGKAFFRARPLFEQPCAQPCARLRAFLLHLLPEAAGAGAHLIDMGVPCLGPVEWFRWSGSGGVVQVEWFRNSPSAVAASVITPRSTPR